MMRSVSGYNTAREPTTRGPGPLGLRALQHRARGTIPEQARGDDVGQWTESSAAASASTAPRRARAPCGEGTPEDNPPPAPLPPRPPRTPGRRWACASRPAESQPVGQPRVDARHRQPRHRHEETWSTSRGVSPAFSSASRTTFSPSSTADVNPRVIALLEGDEWAVRVDGQGQEAPGDVHRAVQILQPLQVEVLLGPQLPEGADELLLGSRSAAGGRVPRRG